MSVRAILCYEIMSVSKTCTLGEFGCRCERGGARIRERDGQRGNGRGRGNPRFLLVIFVYRSRVFVAPLLGFCHETMSSTSSHVHRIHMSVYGFLDAKHSRPARGGGKKRKKIVNSKQVSLPKPTRLTLTPPTTPPTRLNETKQRREPNLTELTRNGA